jgi:ferrous iron transport protein B
VSRVPARAGRADQSRAGYRIALAGNPNSGKTSLFNALTGSRQHVGNYPGVTVEKRVGEYLHEGVRMTILDLPGTYSLTSFSPEERIAQQELLSGEVDAVVVVVDSTTLKRSLMLLAQVMELGANPVLCLNVADEAARAGQKVDLAKLERLLGIPVVETVAHRREGIGGLKEAIRRAIESPARGDRLVLGERLDTALAAVMEPLRRTSLNPRHLRWIANKLLVQDEHFEALVREQGAAGEEALREAQAQRERIETETNMDIVLFVTERYYGFIDGLLREVVLRPLRLDARAVSDRIDSVLVHRLFGLPFFFLTMYAIFWITFRLGEYPMAWLEAGFSLLSDLINTYWPAGAAPAFRSLIVDGVIGGVGGVVAFLPNIALLFLGLAFLEDTGYMARIAFLMDGWMHRFGLHGKSFLPMITGFGCTIPGIMATRTLENERDRLTTILVLPLMPCGARLPIWMLLIPAFFPPALRAPMLWLIYMSGVVLALLVALFLRRTILGGEDAPFVMELPPYRLPTWRAVALKMFERSWLYVRKAGTVILGISILLWVLTSYPKPKTFEVDRLVDQGRIVVLDESATAPGEIVGSLPAAAGPTAAEPGAGVELITARQLALRRAAESLRYSLAGRIGRGLEYLLRPLGFDWRIGTALLGAFAAKEVFVAQMGIIYSLGEVDEQTEPLAQAIQRDYPPIVGLSLIFFLLIGTPCMATLAVTRRETGAWKWAILQEAGLTSLAYAVALVIYQVGRLVTGI